MFVERRAWSIGSYRGLEHDEFDTPAARYLLWVDDSGGVRGVTRLLPTTRPYMLEKLWPWLIRGEPPRSAAVWEATRFGCDRTLDPSSRRRAVAELLCAMQEFGLARRIERYLAVMPVRLLRAVVVNAGCEVEVLGPARRIDRFRTVAAYLTVSPGVLAELRRRAGIRGAVILGAPERQSASMADCRP